jgi:hypothetical protein
MPVHRIPVSLDGAATLDAKVADLETSGEHVTQVMTHANEWIIVTTKGRQVTRAPRETR